MYKKRVDRGRLRNKRAQITIFMIIGLLLLFAFLFILFLTRSLQEAELKEAKESVLSKAFQKEGLRIFVEDCLVDSLTSGLKLIGQQGRLWNDQSGGRKRFEQDVTGTQMADGSRVFYGITNEIYSNHADESYFPCSDGGTGKCTYEYPQTDIGFGNLQWRASTLEGDLERYLVEETLICVTTTVQSELSQQIEVDAPDIDLNLAFNADSITAQVYYPLKLKLGEEELFSLANFDFSYNTKFRQLLDAVIAFSLQQDQQFVDFEFAAPTLLANSFDYGCETDFSATGVCNRNTRSQQFQELSIQMQKTNWFGDDIFEFTLPEGVILETTGEYKFRIARQNRPPALDYVNRCPGTDFDYLVIRGDQGGLGTLDFTASARDPDKDETIQPDPIITMESQDFGLPLTQQATLTYDPASLSGDYTVRVLATDEYGLTDWQDVVIRVQDGINPTLEFRNLASPGEDLSLEDPVCVIVNDGFDGLQVLLNGQGFTVVNDPTLCSLPNDFDSEILTYTNQELLLGSNNFLIQGPSQAFGTAPECNYDINVPQNADVTECTPVSEPNFPYPYIEEFNTLYQYDANGVPDPTRSPFQATRACCNAGTVTDGDPCTFADNLGCFTDPFYLETISGTCGTRGNVCENPVTAPLDPNFNTCGDKTKAFCDSLINDACHNVPAGNFNNAGNWCNGNNGCENVCVLGRDSIVNLFTTEVEANVDATLRQVNPPYIGVTNYACGCDAFSTAQNFICDNNYDGNFNGVCVDNGFLSINRYTCEGD